MLGMFIISLWCAVMRGDSYVSSHGRAKAGRPARTYIQQLCDDTGYNLEELPGAMDDKDGIDKGKHSYSITFWKKLVVKDLFMS